MIGTQAHLVFTGSFVPASFVAFVEHRADRLSLTHRIEKLGTNRVEVSLAGHPDLIDAFEMACSLGPVDCIVRDVDRRAGSSRLEFAVND